MKVIEKNDDILELFASLNNHEIFTPPQIARNVLDLLPKEVWTNPQYKFLDPATKTGVFLREITFRLFEGLKGKGVITGYDGKEYNLNDNQERMNHILKNMVFGISTSELTGYMSRRTLYGVMKASNNKAESIINHLIYISDNNIKTKEEAERSFDTSIINDYYDERIFTKDDNYKNFQDEGNIFYPYQEVDAIKKEFEKEGKDIFGVEDTYFPFIQENIKHKKIKEIKEGEMKFDVIIGNPPYQVSVDGTSAKQIYQDFVLKSINLNPIYISMIIPSRWMTGGKGLDDFRKKILNDNRMKTIYDFKDSKECFNNVDIEGGINYFLWDKNYKSKCRFIEMKDGKEKTNRLRYLNEFDLFIRNNNSITILDKVLKNEINFIYDNISGSNPFNFNTNFKDFKEKEFKNSIKLYGNKRNMKKTNGIGFVEKESVKKNINLINKYKVIISAAYGNQFKVLGRPFYIEPNSVCSQTYIIIGTFKNKEESENLIKYIKTKFFRFLVSLRKNTQHAKKGVYKFVPDLPMTEEWTDEKLYKKYKLTKEEIAYIEENIAPME